MNLSIPELLPWSDPEQVNTRQGPRLLSTAAPDDKFWQIYRDNKGALRAAGVSVSKKGATWQACWWQPLDEEAQEEKIERIEESRATDADYNPPAPEGFDYLPYQRAGIKFAATNDSTLLGDEMGLGKTIQVIGLINDLNLKNVLIICPAFLKLNWRNELNTWLTGGQSVGLADGKTFPKTDIVIINYENVHKWGKWEKQGKKQVFVPGRELSRNWDLRAYDEAHYCKNPKSKRTRAVFSIPAKRKVAMTGTPIPNRPVEIQPILEDLSDNPAFQFWPFTQRYCNARRQSFGWDFSGSSNLDELQALLRSTLMVRRLKAEVLKDLPPKRRQVIPLDGIDEGAVLRKYQEIAEDERDWTEIVDEMASSTEGFQLLSQLRHDLGLAKVPAAVEFLRAASEEGPLLVFAHHKDVVADLARGLEGLKVVTATGDHSKEARQQAVEDFQNGRHDIFIGTIGACGVGLTLTRASRAIFVELDWVPGNVTQAEDRCHRIGQVDSVLIQHLVIDGGLDAHIAKTIVNKQNVIDSALDRAIQLKVEGKITEIEVDDKPVREPSPVEQLPELTADQVAAIHQGLQILSMYCDGARAIDGMGYSKIDARFGHALAAAPALSQKQAHHGLRLVNKYRRQLDGELLARAKNENHD